MVFIFCDKLPRNDENTYNCVTTLCYDNTKVHSYARGIHTLIQSQLTLKGNKLKLVMELNYSSIKFSDIT